MGDVPMARFLMMYIILHDKSTAENRFLHKNSCAGDIKRVS